MFELWTEDASNAYDMLLNDVRAMVVKMQASGMSNEAIMESLLTRLGNTSDEFQSFKGWIEGGTDKLVHSTAQLESNDYPPEKLLRWILDPTASEHCEDCIENATLPPMTIDEWETTGTPASGATLCDGYCKCTLIEA